MSLWNQRSSRAPHRLSLHRPNPLSLHPRRLTALLRHRLRPQSPRLPQRLRRASLYARLHPRRRSRCPRCLHMRNSCRFCRSSPNLHRSLPSPHLLRLLSRARPPWKPRSPRPCLRSLISQRLLHGGTGTITRVKATTPPALGTIPGRDTVHGTAGITDTVLGAVGDTTADTVEAGTTLRGCTIQGIRGGHRTPTAGVTATARYGYYNVGYRY